MFHDIQDKDHVMVPICRSCGREVSEGEFEQSTRLGMCIECADVCDDIEREENMPTDDDEAPDPNDDEAPDGDEE